MSVVKGKNVVLYVQYNGIFQVIACAKGCTLTTAADIGETSSKNTGKWKTFRGRKLSWTVSFDGVCSEDQNLTLPQLRQLQFNLSAVLINFVATDDNGIVEGFSGYCLITDVTGTSNVSGFYEYNGAAQGIGELTISDSVIDPNQCCDTIWYYYDGIGGEYSTGSIPILIGNRIDGRIYRDGTEYRPSGPLQDGTATPVGKQFKFDPLTGEIFFDTSLPAITADEQIDLPYLTCEADGGGGNECTNVSIIDTTLPDANVNELYTQTITLTGTAPFNLQPGYVLPDWLTPTLSGSGILLTGTPSSSDEATDIEIIFTVSNCSGATATFNQTIDVLNEVHFLNNTVISGDSLNLVEDVNIVGIADSTVTITLDHLTNSNGGLFKVNSTAAFEGNTFDVVLDNSGQGSLRVEINGVANPNSIILGHFTITATTDGIIGTPDVQQVSKVFL